MRQNTTSLDRVRRALPSGTMLVAREGETIETSSAGSIAGPGSSPCSPDTRYQAGSISKSMMSVVALHHVEEELLTLDGGIGEWLGELPPHLQKITLRQLLSHTSGLGHWGDLDGLPAVLEMPPTPSSLLERIERAPLLSPPGEGWRYSGPGFLLVALVIEAVAHRSYSDAVTDVVFDRAGMTDTTSGRFPVGLPAVAMGHQGTSTIDVHPGFTELPGTGDIWTTVGDLLTYSRALQSGKLIARAPTCAMLSPQAPVGPPDPPARPLSADSYGYGTFLGHVLRAPGWFVPGDNPGYQALLAHISETDTDVIILSNRADGVTISLEQNAGTA